MRKGIAPGLDDLIRIFGLFDCIGDRDVLHIFLHSHTVNLDDLILNRRRHRYIIML